MSAAAFSRDDSPLAELGEAIDEMPFGSDAGDVRPFTLGAERHQPALPLGGLERIGERMARGLRTVLEPLARARPTVTAQPLSTVRFEAWRSALSDFVSLSHYRAGPLKGGLLVAVRPEFVTRLVDAFYGGTGGPDKPSRATEFTAGEERMAARLADAVVEVAAGAWASAAALAPALAGRETAAAHAAYFRGDEAVVVQRFAVDAGPAGMTELDFVYPLAAIRALPAIAGSGVPGTADPVASDPAFRRDLAAALAQVSLPVRSVLARPTLSVDALLALKPGDVIPIALGPRVPLLVANRRVAEGRIGEQEGRAALMIERIERDA